MNIFDEFKRKYPRQTQTINGKPFPYRYYKNEQSDKTVLLLTGGIGLSDLMVFHFEEFAKSYSVITFDYPIAYASLQQLVDAIASLLESLNIKAYLIGQSLGGFIAQILAKQHPQVVEGMVLSNTGTLSVDMDDSAVQCFNAMMKRLNKSLILSKVLPFSLMKKSIKRAVAKKINAELSPQQQLLMAQLTEEMLKTLTKPYSLHMTLLLKDLQNHWNIRKGDFARFEGKVMLILSDDDATFNTSIKQALISVMPNPKVVTNILGGHLALLLKLDEYAKLVTGFIDGRER